MIRRLTAEFIGTLWLVLGGCGSAVLAAAFPALGIGFGCAAVAVFPRATCCFMSWCRYWVGLRAPAFST